MQAAYSRHASMALHAAASAAACGGMAWPSKAAARLAARRHPSGKAIPCPCWLLGPANPQGQHLAPCALRRMLAPHWQGA